MFHSASRFLANTALVSSTAAVTASPAAHAIQGMKHSSISLKFSLSSLRRLSADAAKPPAPAAASKPTATSTTATSTGATKQAAPKKPQVSSQPKKESSTNNKINNNNNNAKVERKPQDQRPPRPAPSATNAAPGGIKSPNPTERRAPTPQGQRPASSPSSASQSSSTSGATSSSSNAAPTGLRSVPRSNQSRPTTGDRQGAPRSTSPRGAPSAVGSSSNQRQPILSNQTTQKGGAGSVRRPPTSQGANTAPNKAPSANQPAGSASSTSSTQQTSLTPTAGVAGTPAADAGAERGRRTRAPRAPRTQGLSHSEKLMEMIESKAINVPILKDSIRDEIFTLHSSDKQKWTPLALSQKFSLSVARVDAIILLKQHAMRTAITDEKEIEARKKFDALVRSVVQEADVVYDDPISKTNNPPKVVKKETTKLIKHDIVTIPVSPAEEGALGSLSFQLQKQREAAQATATEEEKKKREIDRQNATKKKVVGAHQFTYYS